LFVLASPDDDDDNRVDRALDFLQLGDACGDFDLRKPFMVDGTSSVKIQDGAVPGKAAVYRFRFGVNASTQMAPDRFSVLKSSKKKQLAEITRMIRLLKRKRWQL